MLGGDSMVRRKYKAVHEQEKRKAEAPLGCTHYWIIETPRGATSMGVCKLCGATSQFQNYVPYPSGEGKVTKFPKHDELSDVEPEEEVNNA